MVPNPSAFPFIKPAITSEAPIMNSNVIIIALSKVFFFISLPPKVLYVFLLPNITNRTRPFLMAYP